MQNVSWNGTIDVLHQGETIDTMWLLLTAMGILFMQIGFTAFEGGASRPKHLKSVLFKNLLDHSAGTLGWFFVGWGVFTGDHPFLGVGSFGDPPQQEYARIFQQFGFMATAATVISGSVTSRMRLEAYICLVFVISAFTYPLSAHWAWADFGWLKTLGFLDFAGSVVVHAFGGSCAFAAAILVGTRPGKFRDREIKENPPPTTTSSSVSATNTMMMNFRRVRLHVPLPMPMGGDSTMMVIGVLLLYIGWFSFNAGSAHNMQHESTIAARAAVNTLLASGAGSTTLFLRSLLRRDRVMFIMDACNALLIALVSVTAGCGYMEPWAAVVGGFIAVSAVLPFGEFFVMRVCGVDDVLSAVTVHMFGGMFGAVWLGLVHPTLGAFYTGQGSFFGAQLLGSLVICIFAFGSTLLILLPFHVSQKLGYSKDAQLLGLDMLYFGGEIQGREDIDLESNSSVRGGEVFDDSATEDSSSVVVKPLSQSQPPLSAIQVELKRALDLEDPRVGKRFRAYLTVLHAGEGVEFWDAVLKWKKIKRTSLRMKESKRIIQEFCLEEGSKQVNFKSSTVKKMKLALEDNQLLAQEDLFEECLDEMFKDIKQAFVDFVAKTPNYWL